MQWLVLINQWLTNGSTCRLVEQRPPWWHRWRAFQKALFATPKWQSWPCFTMVNTIVTGYYWMIGGVPYFEKPPSRHTNRPISLIISLLRVTDPWLQIFWWTARHSSRHQKGFTIADGWRTKSILTAQVSPLIFELKTIKIYTTGLITEFIILHHLGFNLFALAHSNVMPSHIINYNWSSNFKTNGSKIMVCMI